MATHYHRGHYEKDIFTGKRQNYCRDMVRPYSSKESWAADRRKKTFKLPIMRSYSHSNNSRYIHDLNSSSSNSGAYYAFEWIVLVINIILAISFLFLYSKGFFGALLHIGLFIIPTILRIRRIINMIHNLCGYENDNENQENSKD